MKYFLNCRRKALKVALSNQNLSGLCAHADLIEMTFKKNPKGFSTSGFSLEFRWLVNVSQDENTNVFNAPHQI